MTKLKIKDEPALIKIFKTISWLDYRRWDVKDNYNYLNFFKNDLTNCEKILTHWICYITDRQMPFEVVWDKGGYVFSELTYEYSRNGFSPQQILNKHYEKYIDDKERERFRFKSADNKYFASRYVTDDYQNILQTLEVLNKSEYKRNIIGYILDIIKKFQDKKDLLVRVAWGLYLLTYELDGKKANHKRIAEIINDNEKFENGLITFKKTSTRGKKRLWCCIRDYKKGLYHHIFNKAIKEVAPGDAEELKRKWKKLPISQIELPGDVWNNSPLFRDNLFANMIEIESIPKTWRMPDVIRELYNRLKENNNLDDFYPEQFDVTFDFVPRMCNKQLCNVCPFGKNGIDYTCIPTKDKHCPISLFSCGYIAKCSDENCILKEGSTKGICKGGLK
jgi:hypothetical protein